tara:strand:- start:1879 stop:2109 length:231 start_codon:yes stop_codon:yes gene_type:complete
VTPDATGRVAPPAVYPVPETSLVVLYAVVEAPKVALDVYKAILNVWDVSLLKSISPPRRAALKDVQTVWVIAMIYP